MTADDLTNQRMGMASRLREAREYLGLSQEEVAAALKLPRPAVGNIEAGSRKVEAFELEQLSRLYGQSVAFFLTGTEERDTKVAFAARALKGLSAQDLDEVARFASFLRASSGNKTSRGKK